MTVQWKRSPVAYVFFTLLLAAAGCRPSSSPLDVTPTPHRDVQLRIACPSDTTAELLRSRGQNWALRQGATLAIQRYDPAKEPAPLGENAAVDVCLIAPAELPRWAAADRLAPLPDNYKLRDHPFAWSDLLPTYRDQLILWDGKPYAFPVVGESPLCCYRADWLNDPAHQAAMRKLLGSGRTEPATWEQFAQLAEYFHEHGMGGLPPLPRADADLDRLFYQVAAGYARRALRTNEERDAAHAEDAFSFHYDVKTGQPRIASAGFVHALKWLQRVQKCRPPEPKDQDHPEKAFAAGRAVLCLTDVPWLKTFQQRPDLRDKIGLCRLPGGECSFDFATGRSHAEPDGNRVPYLGGAGWLAVVRRDSEHVETAFDLLADLSGPKTSMQIFLSAVGRGGPLRTSQLYRHRWDAFDLDAKQSQRLPEVLQDTLLHRQLKNPALCLRTPRQAEHRAVLVAGLRRALLQGADAEATLREVAEGWRKLDERQGAEKHQADYRRSLGLLAQ